MADDLTRVRAAGAQSPEIPAVMAKRDAVIESVDEALIERGIDPADARVFAAGVVSNPDGTLATMLEHVRARCPDLYKDKHQAVQQAVGVILGGYATE